MSTDNQGSFALVLHSHIPYVLSHGLWVNGLNWLTEAVAESYLPLLEVLDRLVSEGISPQITVGLTPILLEQLADSEFPTLFESYLKTQLDFVLQNEAEFQRAGSPHKRGLALYWRDFYNHSMKLYNEVYEKDLISQFRRLQDEGHITLLAGSAKLRNQVFFVNFIVKFHTMIVEISPIKC